MIRWLVAVNVILWCILMGILVGRASAQAPGPVQTINMNDGVPCNAIGSPGQVTRCRAQWSYGCTSSTTGQQILATDGQRTGIIFQSTGTIPIVLVFGDTAMGNNGFVVQAGKEFIWSNVGQGNLPGRLLTSAISVISTGATSCAFLFTN